ncbi:MAG: sulfite exporter TauE/SafE family protein [Sedimentisphaerales bacterium]|nr:sulfite exporter TauE/SafE family protein [Sedimentisphaerales bacterium]
MFSSIQKLISDTPFLAVFVVFWAGALASLSSCTIVRVPVALGFIAGAAESKKKALLVTLLFVTGLVAAYTALGIFLGIVGRMAFTIIQVNKYIFYLLGLLLFITGLFIAGLVKVRRLPRLLQFRENFHHVTLISAFVFGILFALLEMPSCPTCGGLLLMLASLVVTHNLAPFSVLIFVSFAIGQSFPVLAVALSASLVKTDVIMFLAAKVQRVEDHINFVSGNVLMTLGIYYLIVA